MKYDEIINIGQNARFLCVFISFFVLPRNVRVDIIKVGIGFEVPICCGNPYLL